MVLVLLAEVHLAGKQHTYHGDNDGSGTPNGQHGGPRLMLAPENDKAWANKTDNENDTHYKKQYQ